MVLLIVVRISEENIVQTAKLLHGQLFAERSIRFQREWQKLASEGPRSNPSLPRLKHRHEKRLKKKECLLVIHSMHACWLDDCFFLAKRRPRHFWSICSSRRVFHICRFYQQYTSTHVSLGEVPNGIAWQLNCWSFQLFTTSRETQAQKELFSLVNTTLLLLWYQTLVLEMVLDALFGSAMLTVSQAFGRLSMEKS